MYIWVHKLCVFWIFHHLWSTYYPTLNKSSAISWFQLKDLLKISGKVMFATCICVKWAVFITRKATIIAHAHLNVFPCGRYQISDKPWRIVENTTCSSSSTTLPSHTGSLTCCVDTCVPWCIVYNLEICTFTHPGSYPGSYAGSTLQSAGTLGITW